MELETGSRSAVLASERLWILLLALTAFLAGGAGGILIGRKTLAPRVEVGPFADFEARFVETFSLNEEKRQDLHYILDRYHAEVEAAESDLVVLLEDDLEEIGAKWRERIRTWILAPQERDEFDRLIAATPSLTN